MDRKILVIGGTGAQGTAVAKALLKSKQSFKLRILTRNPDDPMSLETFSEHTEVEFVGGKSDASLIEVQFE